MSLPPGRRLGRYGILSPLGAGGMGEVLKAKDTRLQRMVAVRVLPSELSSDAERRSRFEREAHAASALNHPNITTVFDIGEDEGTHYIVMEPSRWRPGILLPRACCTTSSTPRGCAMST
jgi:serine/threonine protein kinase